MDNHKVRRFFETRCNIHSLIVTTDTVTTDEDRRTRAGGSVCSNVSTTHCLIIYDKPL